MDRRRFLQQCGCGLFVTATGCRGTQKAHVLSEKDKDMVGSHTAGAETWEPLIEQSVGQLLGRQSHVVQTAGGDLVPGRKRICFVGVENKSIEELGDFKEQIYQKIDTCVNHSDAFDVIHRKYVEAGLKQCGLRPDDLFVPNNRRNFVASMEQLDQPFDYLLYATVTSGTTKSNQKNYQRDYTLTLEMIDLQSGRADKESAELSKGYHKSRLGKVKHYGL
ncbi:MAG: penicillin-binding protein activator LpoB [Planctomycetaceae bacterium]|nr:penicillin-binding protein activator LpoB [Planctomycetaceae bacterium]